MATKKTPVKFTNREFDTIKLDLVNYAKRFYPDTYKNFGDASFGSMMIDMVAGVGDMLSYYVDYQANEMFLDNAQEVDNILKLGSQLGYKQDSLLGASGIVDFYCIVPANSTGLGPDENYMPVIRAGAALSSDQGSSYVLSEDVRFDYSQNEVVVARVDDTTGVPSHYAIKASGNVLAGKIKTITVKVDVFEKFKKIKVPDASVLEILTVTDSDGNEYFEVDYLSQDVIYRPIANRGSDSNNAPSILKPFSVPRRFVAERLSNETFLQFGAGSSSELTDASVAEPSRTALQMHGKNYSTDSSFDPSKLMATDSLGIAPSDTTMTIQYRTNNSSDSNAAVNSIKNITSIDSFFSDSKSLSVSKMSDVRGSIEVSNSFAIDGSVAALDSTELKRRIKDSFATQNRAVTKQDLESTAYSMPAKYGSIKRCRSRQAQCVTRRNIEFYVLSEDITGKLSIASNTLKQNLKVWLSERKMMNDTIDVRDAKIINIGINFSIVADSNKNKYDVLNNALSAVKDAMAQPLYIGEPIYVTDIYGILNKVDGVVDTKNVSITNKSGAGYSSTSININSMVSPDGLTVEAPENVCFECKYPESDIGGSVS
tara:strand:+ start:511 stop:2304 length:1794 start_codon:yes stop_codon:yes gene_type:complete